MFDTKGVKYNSINMEKSRVEQTFSVQLSTLTL